MNQLGTIYLPIETVTRFAQNHNAIKDFKSAQSWQEQQDEEIREMLTGFMGKTLDGLISQRKEMIKQIKQLAKEAYPTAQTVSIILNEEAVKVYG